MNAGIQFEDLVEGKQFKGVRNHLLGKKGKLYICCMSFREVRFPFSGLETNTGCPHKTGETQQGCHQLAKDKGFIMCNSGDLICIALAIFSCLQWEDMLVHIPNSADRTRE